VLATLNFSFAVNLWYNRRRYDERTPKSAAALDPNEVNP
jgi:hypothetical protein